MRRACLAITIALLAAVGMLSPAGAACIGDCDDGGSVTINELIRAVNIALAQSTIATCPAIDADFDGMVEISELVGAVNASLFGCPGAPTATPPHTHTPSPDATQTSAPTPTATVNQPPVLPTASIYRTFPDLPIRVTLNASDPEGEAVQCIVDNLPLGAAFDEDSGVLTWTPTETQLGPFHVPYTCTDGAALPAAAQGQLTFSVTALDACTIPTCDPATGCTTALRPLTEACCTGPPVARVIEPVAGCPEGRVLYGGQNTQSGFGRLQNCDTVVLRTMDQSGAEMALNVETRCLNTLTRIRLAARMDSTAANHPQVFDIQAPPFLFTPEDDGFARRRGYRFEVSGGGPFFDVEGVEANLSVTLTDTLGVTVTEELRVRLSFTPRPDLPDVDPTPTPG